MKKKFEFSGKRFFVILLCLAFAINPSLGFCLPEGENVVSGQASFDRSQDSTLNINTPSENLIVNYDSFSIAQPEAVHFFQPSSSAIALNRVVGADPSAIYGLLTANGRIFLINPNGVLFGQGARVDAAGLVASTLDISNENFLSGNYNFFKNGLNSFVVNQGQITITNGGYAFLLSQGIDNQGSIKADLGKVVLASGEKMTLALDDLSEISVVLDEAVKNEVFGASGEKIDSAVKNSGTITADGGKVTLTAKALNTVFDYAINNTGVIQANALVSNNGVIELLGKGAPIINIGKVAADGSIEAPNAGKVSIAGPEVLQQGQVSTNAAEAGKAGEISIVSENQATLGTGSSTEAKAQGSVGEGGKIFIDSTAGNTAVNSGAVIDVSAGSQAGNAGAVEISALKVLNFDGIINGWAPLGYLGGVAILDPTDATISGTLNANTTVWATNDITITNTVIINGSFTLNLFADHNSETAGDWEDGIGAILNPNDRRIEAADGTDTALNLKAGSGIGIDNPITTRKVHTLTAEINPDFGAGDINLVSDPADVSLRLAGIFTPSGNISIENRNNVAIIIDRLSPDPVFSFAIETDNGSVTIANVGPISIPGTNSDGILATGDITLITTDGNADITADADNTFAALWSIDGDIILDAGNNISLGEVSAVSVFADSGNISLIAGNDISIINGTLINAVLGNIELTAGNNIDLGLLEALGVVTLTAGGQVSDNNGVDNNIAANDLFVTGVLGIDLDTSINTLTAVSADSDITISEFDDLAVNTVDAGTGNVTLELASGAITDNNLEANNVSANGLSLSAPLGIDLDTQVASLTASTTNTDIAIREADDVAINTINAGTANIDLSSLLGSITDANAALNNITANSLLLIVNSGIDLDTTVNSLDAIAGSLTIDEFDAITLTALDIFGGNISITAGNTITATDLLASDITGNISLTANTGNILVDTIEAGNTVELNALLGGVLDNNLVENNIISTNLIAQGATGINLDTLIDTLTASTSDANITIREADDVALNTVDAGTADVNLSSAVGAITDNNAGLNNVIANTLTLDVATGVDLDTMITSLVATVNDIGNLSIDEADDIILTELLTIDGNIAVTAGSAITALDLLALDTNVDGIGGDISLSADTGDINVYSLAADNDIDLSAASGAIVDSNGIDNNIIANSLTLTANSGIDLGTTVNSLDAILTGIGDLFIDEANEITLTTIEVINGNINLNAAGTLTALNLLAQDIDADAIGGNIFLTASLGDIVLGTLSADYTVDLVSSLGAITDNNGATNNITANELILTANSGINLDSAVVTLTAATTNADIAIRETDDVAINTINAGTANVDLSSASGAISDNNGIDNNIAANNLTLTANSGVDLDTTVNALDAILTGNGNLVIDEFDAIDLSVLGSSGASTIDITAGSTITATDLLTLDSNGNIFLTALIGDINIGSIEAGGSIILTAALGAINEIGLGDVEVDLTASVIDLFAKEEIGSALDELDIETDADILIAESTNAKDIAITEDNDIAIDTITTTGDVYLSSPTGSITDANAALNNIFANNLTLTANSDIDLDTNVNSLDAIAGSLTIDEANAITLTALETFGGDINIAAGNTITTVDLLASDVNGNIILTANTGDILVDTLEAGNTVELNALLGGILDNNLGANNIISTNLIAQGATGINLDTLVDTLSASTTNANITIREADDVALNTVNAGIANVDLSSASGAITDNNAGLNNVTANTLTLTAVTGIDFDTDINSLDAIVTGTGNLAIDEANSIILTTLDVIDGNIAVTAGSAITALDLLAMDTDLDGVGGDISLSADTGDILVDTLTADDTIDLSAASGSIVDNNGGNNNILSSNLILTASLGIDLDTTVDSLDAIVTGIGDLTIDELDSITLAALDVINGNINLNAGSTITALDLLAQDIDIDGIGGNIFLTANSGDISLGALTADYTVDLTSILGAITDNNLAATNVTADELILNANSGIDLDSAVNFLNAQTTTGNIDISNDTDLLTIDDFSLGNLVGVITDNGNVTIANTGSIDLPGTNGDGISATGGITITSSNGNITAGAENPLIVAWSNNGSINLNAGNDIYLGEVFAADLLISNGLGAINLTTVNGDITVDNGTNINSNAGDITLTSGNDISLLETLQLGAGTLIISDASGNITLDAANNINLGVLQTTGDVNLTANSGTISDNNDIDNNITANNLVITANSGVDLDTTVNALDAILTGNGDLLIDEFDAIDLTVLGGTTIDITAGNTITATDLLTLNGDIILTALAGGINIGAIEAGGSIILTAAEGAINEIGLGDADIDLTASVIDLFAKDEIGSIVDELDIETDADILSAESTNAKDIVITEANNVAIETVTTGGDVYLDSILGSILDANAALNNITADGLTLTAADDVDLDTTVNTLDAIIGDNLTIREADDVSLYAIDVLGGNVNISAGNVLTITDSLLTNGGGLILSAANGIMQEQLGDVDTTAGEGIGAGSYTANADSNNDYIGTYTLASGGSIYTQDIDGSGEVEITAADIDLGSGSLIAAGDKDVSLIPSFDGITPLTIGLGNAAGDFTLNNDELNSILTSGTVIIGDDNSGNILVREVAPDLLSFSDLMLITGGNINDIAGQLGIAISRLRLEAGLGIGESSNPLNINVDSLKASTDLGSIFIDEADDIGLEELTAPDSIQLNANGEINDDNADLVNINTLDLLLTAGNGIGDLEDAIETEIETLDAYAANGGIFIDELDDLALNLVNAEGDDVMLATGGSILDNDLGAAPDDFDILGANITLDVGGHIGSSGEEEEVDLDLDSLVSLTENSRPDAPTDLNSLSHILGSWSNNNLVDVAWTAAINPNYYTGSDNSIAGYSFVWDNAAGTIPDEIQDIGDITSLDDILLGDSASNYLHIRSLNSSGNWSDPVHLGSFKIDTVAPVITASRNSGPNINGWHNSDVTVGFDGIDELSGIDSITAPIIISTEGEGQSVIGIVTDLAGNSAQVTEDNINIDKTVPVISSSRNVGPNANGWNNSDVMVNFSGSDGLSGVDSITGPVLISTEGQGQSVIGAITDLAGNSVSITEDNINIDKTAPVISSSRNIGPNINGFNNSDVTVSFNGVDGLSGVANITAPILFGSEGLNQSAAGTVTDLAGNSASITEAGINIDKSAPVISVIAPVNGAVVANQQVLSFGVSDNLTAAPLLTGPASGTVFNTQGTQNILLTATDLAGNISEELVTFTITSDFLESQISNATILNPFFFTNPQATGQFQVSSFDSVGSVFFYHPLTPVDMSAFEGMAIEEEVCDFIDGTLCVKSKDESTSAKDAKKEDKKGEKK